jgi:hypothetical protein
MFLWRAFYRLDVWVNECCWIHVGWGQLHTHSCRFIDYWLCSQMHSQVLRPLRNWQSYSPRTSPPLPSQSLLRRQLQKFSKTYNSPNHHRRLRFRVTFSWNQALNERTNAHLRVDALFALVFLCAGEKCWHSAAKWVSVALRRSDSCWKAQRARQIHTSFYLISYLQFKFKE